MDNTLRQRKISEKDQRIDLAYLANPKIKELDDQIRKAAISALRYSNAGEKIKAEIDELTEKREAELKKIGKDSSIYEVWWDCPICQDTGFSAPGVPCSCQVKKNSENYKALSGLYPLQMTMAFDNFSLEWYEDPDKVSDIKNTFLSFARNISSGDYPGNLFLFGPVGNGKTHLVSAAANFLIEKGKKVCYRQVGPWLDEIREAKYGESEEGNFNPAMLDADLLILEDLGCERLTDFSEEQLTNVIDNRTNACKPWIVTSSLIGEDLTRRYSERFIDRLLGQSKKIYFKESSVRRKMNR